MGIHNVQYPAFDRITFEWQSSARIYVCFNCLSTDFSRIKGVKGIPLRVSLQNYTAKYQHYERSLCKIKLFRDKVCFVSFSLLKRYLVVNVDSLGSGTQE